MDTLKSYFTKMKILPGSGSRNWKFRKGNAATKKAKYSRSKSQSDANFDTPMDTDQEFGLNRDRSASTLTARATLFNTNRDPMKSPPTKPPRKSQIFVVDLQVMKHQILGISLDFVSAESGSRTDSERTSGEHEIYDSTDELNSRGVPSVGITEITEGSVAETDGQLKVNDEIIDIDGVSMIGEPVTNVRERLMEAVKSGHVTMTVRRKRKRPAPLPPTPNDRQSSLQQPYSSSSSNITETLRNGLSPPSQNGMTQSTSCLDTEYYKNHINGSGLILNSLTSSVNSLTASNDDVFTEIVEPEYSTKNMTYLNGFSNTINSPRQQRRGVMLDDERLENYDPDRQRTQSASAVEDVQWKAVPVDNTYDYVNTAELAKRRNFNGVLSSISVSNNSETDLNLYQSDTELQLYSRHNKRKNSRNQEVFRLNNNSTPTSLCSFDEGSEYDMSCQSSPCTGKKRIIARMHLLKEDNSLGLHIAGGRGSKRGDIGIFVAGISEGGPAFRDGRLKRGDELLMINGRSLIGLTHYEAVEVLRSSPKLVQLVVAAKVRKATSIASTTSSSTTVTSPGTTDGALGYPPVPEVLAQTPQGTVVNWEELFDKFSRPIEDKPPSGSQYTKRRTRSPTSRQLAPQTLTVVKGDRGKGLGFTIVGGKDTSIGKLGIIVRRIFARGLIAEDGRIKEGDEILELNGEPLFDLTHREVISRFRKLKKGPVTLTFRKRIRSPHCSPARSPHLTPATSCDGSPVSTPGHSPRGSLSDLHSSLGSQDDDFSFTEQPLNISNHRPTFSVPVTIPRAPTPVGSSCIERLSPDNKPKIQQEVLLHKDTGVGLGISVIRKTNDGTSEIHVQDISHGSPAEKDGRLRKGDMIVEVNGRSMRDMTLLDAYQLFRSLPPGPVVIVIRRGDNCMESNQTAR